MSHGIKYILFNIQNLKYIPHIIYASIIYIHINSFTFRKKNHVIKTFIRGIKAAVLLDLVKILKAAGEVECGHTFWKDFSMGRTNGNEYKERKTCVELSKKDLTLAVLRAESDLINFNIRNPHVY